MTPALLVDALEIFSHVANLGDTCSSIIHPARPTANCVADRTKAGVPALCRACSPGLSTTDFDQI
jgi:O-acetylhomoserine/O-acetylserine sulfhydrylase-like pyridoxal-dependent enzyme